MRIVDDRHHVDLLRAQIARDAAPERVGTDTSEPRGVHAQSRETDCDVPLGATRVDRGCRQVFEPADAITANQAQALAERQNSASSRRADPSLLWPQPRTG